MESWDLTTEDGQAGVDLHRREIVYWRRPHGPMGRFGEIGTSQSIESFLRHGPSVPIPDRVIDGILEALGSPATTWRSRPE